MYTPFLISPNPQTHTTFDHLNNTAFLNTNKLLYISKLQSNTNFIIIKVNEKGIYTIFFPGL